MLKHIAVGALVAVIGAANAAASECLPADAVISGEVRVVEGRHPNGQSLKGVVLFLPPGQCVTVDGLNGDMVDLPLRDIHLAFSDGAPSGYADWIGEIISATGEMGEPHTAWHLGSVVMFDAKIVN
ncbi:MAG: hypothetical protein EA385_12910 [Salinarimonadaceae bacterium]|nr:MAG: hypothetical protein EA385_12910 [Salinarimonadaceae bacterium]